MFRKVAMIFITVFLSSLGRIVQALAVILLLIFYLFLTIRKKPYTTRRLNSLEIASLLTSSITIYAGVFFLSSRDSADPSFTPNIDSNSLIILSDARRRNQVGPRCHHHSIQHHLPLLMDSPLLPRREALVRHEVPPVVQSLLLVLPLLSLVAQQTDCPQKRAGL